MPESPVQKLVQKIFDAARPHQFGVWVAGSAEEAYNLRRSMYHFRRAAIKRGDMTDANLSITLEDCKLILEWRVSAGQLLDANGDVIFSDSQATPTLDGLAAELASIAVVEDDDADDAVDKTKLVQTVERD